jgi:hypothetical protein
MYKRLLPFLFAIALFLATAVPVLADDTGPWPK